MKNPLFIAQFLGNKIVVRDEKRPHKYELWTTLSAIFADGLVEVTSKDGKICKVYPWERLESPYAILLDRNADVEVI